MCDIPFVIQLVIYIYKQLSIHKASKYNTIYLHTGTFTTRLYIINVIRSAVWLTFFYTLPNRGYSQNGMVKRSRGYRRLCPRDLYILTINVINNDRCRRDNIIRRINTKTLFRLCYWKKRVLARTATVVLYLLLHYRELAGRLYRPPSSIWRICITHPPSPYSLISFEITRSPSKDIFYFKIIIRATIRHDSRRGIYPLLQICPF